MDWKTTDWYYEVTLINCGGLTVVTLFLWNIYRTGYYCEGLSFGVNQSSNCSAIIKCPLPFASEPFLGGDPAKEDSTPSGKLIVKHFSQWIKTRDWGYYYPLYRICSMLPCLNSEDQWHGNIELTWLQQKTFQSKNLSFSWSVLIGNQMWFVLCGDDYWWVIILKYLFSNPLHGNQGRMWEVRHYITRVISSI